LLLVLKKTAEEDMLTEAHEHPIARVPATAPGVGPSRVAQLLPSVVTPQRTGRLTALRRWFASPQRMPSGVGGPLPCSRSLSSSDTEPIPGLSLRDRSPPCLVAGRTKARRRRSLRSLRGRPHAPSKSKSACHGPRAGLVAPTRQLPSSARSSWTRSGRRCMIASS
jgi:hypothetical protein